MQNLFILSQRGVFMAKNKEHVWALLIVGIVALLGVSTFFTGFSSADLSGHATSVIKTKATTKTTVTASTACVDSDGGKEYEEKGTTQGIMWTSQSSGVKEYTDSCKDSTSLQEYRCVAADGTTDGTAFAYFNTVTCTQGYCLDGACVSGCYDTDGSNFNTLGTVIFGGTEYTDTCCTDGVECAGYTDSGHVKEYTCSNGRQSVVYPSCTTGKTCVDGACV